MTRIAGRAALLVGALLVTVLLAEILLQAGAWIVRATGRTAPAGFETPSVRVLCMGDSNTYGLYLPPEEAYPKQLEALWAMRAEEPPIEVLNLGYPGTNSSVLLREFARSLELLEPAVVVAMVGVNDFWTEVAESAPEAGLAQRVGAWVRRRSRVWKMLTITWPGIGGEPAPAVERVDAPIPPGPRLDLEVGGERLALGWTGEKRPTRKDDADRLRANLVRLAAEAERHGATLVLMTYPADAGIYKRANDVIRSAAAEAGVRLVDLASVFRTRCPDAACEPLLFPDRHARAAGYAVAAETLAEAMRDVVTTRVAPR